MLLEILIVAVLPALLIVAAVYDLASYTIPNLLNASLLMLFIVFVMMMAITGEGMSWTQAGFHLLAGTIGLLVGVALFATGKVGGGDAKLFAVVALWLGWNVLFEYALLATLLGGGLTLALLILRGMILPPFLMKQEWLARLADRKAGVPYGVALAAAALVMLPRTELFGLAVGG